MPARMSTGHLLLALCVGLVWGVNFVVIKIGLDHFPPLLFSALRFLVAAVPAILVLRSPGVAWRWVALVALTFAVLKFGLLFFGMAAGMPPGLSSLVIQAQAPFTAVIAVAVLGERLSRRQITGLAVALAGVALIALDLGAASPVGAFLLIIAAAAMWGVSNVAIRHARPPDSLRFIVWVSALAVLPLAGLSLIVDGPQRDLDALRTAPWSAFGAVLYIGLLATIFGIGVWGYLIRTYSASMVAPFSLLAPVFAMASSALFVGERLTPLRIIAAVLIMAGVLAVAFSQPVHRENRPAIRADPLLAAECGSGLAVPNKSHIQQLPSPAGRATEGTAAKGMRR